MKRSAPLWAPILAAVILAQPSISNAVPNVFMSGDPIDAGEMNTNFADLEQRLAAIEDGDNQIVPVDCSAGTGDPNAFLDPNPVPITDNTTYLLQGMCNGPIEIWRKRNVILQGDPAGVPKDDGVILPGGLTDNPFAAVGIYESNAELRDLTIDALAYVTNAYPFNSTIAAVAVGQHAMARIYDVDIDGGDYGISAFRQAYVKTYNNIRVLNFNLYGIEAWGNAHVDVANAIEVTGAASTSADYPYAINSSSGGFVQINDGGSFTPAGSGSKEYNYSLGSYDNGVIQIKDSGTTTLNGDVESMRGSSIRILGGTTIIGYVGAYDAGKIRLQGGTVQSGGSIDSYRNSTIRIRGGSSITGDVRAHLTSSIYIHESSTVTGDISATSSSSIEIWNGTVTGDIQSNESSNIALHSTTQTGRLSAYQSGSVNFDNNSSHSGGWVHSYKNGTIVVSDSTLDLTVDPINDNIYADYGSHITLQDSTVIPGPSLNINRYSTLHLQGSTDLGNAGVFCNDSQSNQLEVDVAVINIGSLVNCSP